MKFIKKLSLISSILALSLITSCGGGGGGGGNGGGGGGNGGGTGGASDKIFYLRASFSGTYDLCVINGDNTGNRHLTNYNDSMPKTVDGIAPDGNVIYSYYGAIYAVPLASGPTVTIATKTSNPVVFEAITSNSRVISTVTGTDGSIFSTTTDGLTRQLLAGGTYYENFIGVAGNDQVVYWDSAGLYSASPVSPYTVTTLAALVTLTDPVVSGNYVLYSTMTGTTGLYMVDLSTMPTVTPVSVQLDSGTASNIAVSGGYAFYTKSNAVYAVNLAGTPNVVQLSSGAGFDRFLALTPSPDNRVIFRRTFISSDDIYSVNLIGTPAETALANSSANDTYEGLTPDNRVIIETEGAVFGYDTITSVKSDGTGIVTLATGTTTGDPAQGGIVQAVTANGWVIYQRGDATTTLTGVKADNSSRGTFTNWDARLGVTSNNRIVALGENMSGAPQLYTVDPSGTNPVFLNTGATLSAYDQFVKVLQYP